MGFEQGNYLLQGSSPPGLPGDESLIAVKSGDGSSIQSDETCSQRQYVHKVRAPQKNTTVDTSSLDFERVVNLYTIQAARDRLVALDRDDTSIFQHDSKRSARKEHFNKDYNTFEGTDSDHSLPPPPPPPPPLSPQKSLGLILSRLTPKPHALGYTGRTATRWIFTLFIGVMTGIIAITILGCTDSIQKWRSDTVDTLWRQQSRNIFTFALFTAINLSLALLSAVLCLYLAPQAIGSGIPEVKAYLNGVRVERFSNIRLFFVKIFGTILSVSSGLAIGPEGPLVHTGAIIGSSCTKLSSTLSQLPSLSCIIEHRFFSSIMMDLSHFAQDAERRDFVSTGAATGFAAAFGAPIGGLLFSLEEASSYYDHTMFLKTLVATSVATFCLAVHHGDLSDYSVISLSSFNSSNDNIFLNRVEEFPLYILVAVVGGVMGGVFVQCWKRLKVWNRSYFKSPLSRQRWSLCQVALVSLLTSTICYCIPLMSWTCRPIIVNGELVNESRVISSLKFYPRQFDCQNGQINELASVFFGSREDTISAILTDPTQFSPMTLWCVGIVFYILMTLTAGVALPSGIFMPTFLIGSSLGGAAGTYFHELFGGKDNELSPSTFALLGAAALLAGIQRSTVSLCVILVEGTGQVKVLIPVIVTVVVARYVGDKVSKHGLYETAMEVAHFPYLEHEEKRNYDIIQVSEIMSTPPVTIGPREKAYNIQRLLRESGHHGFPVVEPFTRRFLGLVRRDQLVALLECCVFEDTQIQDEEESTSSSLSARSSAYPETPEQWTPRPGIGKSPLMRQAYHITDDRYDHVVSEKHIVTAIVEDMYDKNDWLLSVRQRSSLIGRRDRAKNAAKNDLDNDLIRLIAHSFTEERSQAAVIVGTNDQGNVIVSWLNPNCRSKWVNVAAVMNKGTYCVTEFCPVSKAYRAFTSLGLRHLIVLGGDGGGQVVGILTRLNFVLDFVQSRIDYKLE